MTLSWNRSEGQQYYETSHIMFEKQCYNNTDFSNTCQTYRDAAKFIFSNFIYLCNYLFIYSFVCLFTYLLSNHLLIFLLRIQQEMLHLLSVLYMYHTCNFSDYFLQLFSHLVWNQEIKNKQKWNNDAKLYKVQYSNIMKPVFFFNK